MTHALHVEIADIHFAIRSAYPLILPGSNSYQSFFVGATEDALSADIDVQLLEGSLPSTAGLEMLFDSGQAWTMFAASSKRYLSLTGPMWDEGPPWLAEFGCDLQNVTVHCSEQMKRFRDGSVALLNPVSYPLDQVLFIYALARRAGALVHAAGAQMGTKGLIFPGRSGAGKTTLSRLLLGAEGLSLLSDDRIAIRRTDGSFGAFGTPWPGDAGIAVNEQMPLSAILFLRHADHNEIGPLSEQQALERLLPVTSIPWYEREIMPSMLAWCEDLVSRVPAFELGFQPEPEVVELLRGFVASG
jgi:hypothetical protein